MKRKPPSCRRWCPGEKGWILGAKALRKREAAPVTGELDVMFDVCANFCGERVFSFLIVLSFLLVELALRKD